MNIDDRLEKIKELKDGWNYGEGKATTDEALNNAEFIIKSLKGKGLIDIEAFPDNFGGILISIDISDGSLDIFCNSDNSFDIETAITKKFKKDDILDHLNFIISI